MNPRHTNYTPLDDVRTTMKRWNHRFAFRLASAGLLIFFAGCPTISNSPASKPVSTPKQPLVLLVADDPELGKAIAREWLGRTEEPLTVRDASLQELTAASRLPADAVIFPTGLLGQLAERALIMPLEPAALEDAEFHYRDIFEQIRLREMRWGTKTLAAPLGSPQFLLAYRADMFEKLGLEPPTDWTAYQKAVGRLSDRESLGDLVPPTDKPWQAAMEPLADGWAGQVLLARAAAYAMHRETVSPLFKFDSMTPLVDQPPYVRALEELVAAAKLGGFAEAHQEPAGAYSALLKGSCAMALTWAMPRSESSASSTARIAFALVPGSSQSFRLATKTWENRGEDDPAHVSLLAISGRMAAVASSASDARRAQGFVLWLASRDTSTQLASHSAAITLFRNSQIAASSRWTGSLPPEASRQYAEVLAQMLSLPRSFPGVKLPGRSDYLAALDKAVHDALDGKPAAEALTEAANAWREITSKLGTEEQRRANAHSLGQAD